jgi:hypothetical protein
VYDNTILGGVLHSGRQDGALSSMTLVKFNELLKRVVTDNIGIEHKEQP